MVYKIVIKTFSTLLFSPFDEIRSSTHDTDLILSVFIYIAKGLSFTRQGNGCSSYHNLVCVCVCVYIYIYIYIQLSGELFLTILDGN